MNVYGSAFKPVRGTGKATGSATPGSTPAGGQPSHLAADQQQNTGFGDVRSLAARGANSPAPVLTTELVRQAKEKVRRPTVSMAELHALVSSLPEAEQHAAWETLRQCAPNGNPYWVMKATVAGLKQTSGRIVSLRPADCASVLAVHFGKAESGRCALLTPAGITDLVRTGKCRDAVLVENLSEPLDSEVIEVLAHVPNLQYLSVHHFESGPNYLDFAAGPDAVTKKLRAVISGMPANGTLEDRVHESLSAHCQANLTKLNQRRALLGMPLVECKDPGMPPVSLSELGTYFAPPPLEKDETANWPRAAWEFLASPVGFQFYAPDRVMAEMRTLRGRIEAALLAKGIRPDEAALVLDDHTGTAKSQHLMTFMYCLANDLSLETVVPLSKLNSARQPIRAAIFIDDLLGSGQQTSFLMQEKHALSNVQQIVAARLVRSEKATELRSRDGLLLVESRLYEHALDDAEHPYHRAMPSRGMLENIGALIGGKWFRAESHEGYEPERLRRALKLHVCNHVAPGDMAFFLSNPDNSVPLVREFVQAMTGIASFSDTE